MAEAGSTFRQVMDGILGICRAEPSPAGADQRYKVVSGPVAWQNWDFDAFPYGMSVQATDGDLWGKAGKCEQIVTLDMMTKMPEQPVTDADNDVLFDLRESAMKIVKAVLAEVADGGDSLVDSLTDPKFALQYDTLIGVQGGEVTFLLRYYTGDEVT
jgi:hypothetical protein